jgi:hypothetical protein
MSLGGNEDLDLMLEQAKSLQLKEKVVTSSNLGKKEKERSGSGVL